MRRRGLRITEQNDNRECLSNRCKKEVVAAVHDFCESPASRRTFLSPRLGPDKFPATHASGSLGGVNK